MYKNTNKSKKQSISSSKSSVSSSSTTSSISATIKKGTKKKGKGSKNSSKTSIIDSSSSTKDNISIITTTTTENDSNLNQDDLSKENLKENSLSDNNLVENENSQLNLNEKILLNKNQTSLEKVLQKPSKTKKKEKKIKKNIKIKQYSLAVTPISTSVLKFNKKIRKPQVRISIYDIESGKLLGKNSSNNNNNNNNSNNNEKEENNIKLQSENVYLTEHGVILSSNSFSFIWSQKNSTFIIDKETNYMQNTNIIIFFELIDNTNINIESIDKCYYIGWSYYKPINSEKLLNHKDEIIPLQLYNYNKVLKPSDTIYDEWIKRKRKQYPGVLNIKFDCQQIIDTTNNNDNKKITSQQKSSSINRDIPSTSNVNNNDNVYSSINPNICYKSLDLNQISKLKETISFKIPEKMIFKSNIIENCKGSSTCAFSTNCNLFAFSLINYKRTSDIVIIDLLDLKQKHVLKGHEGFIHYLEWSNRKFDFFGEMLLSCSEDQTCIIWQVLEKSYEIKHVLFHPTFVYTAAFLVENISSLGGVATGSRDKILRIWKLDKVSNTLILFQELNKHNDLIIGVVYAFQSNKLFSADKAGNFIEWKYNETKSKWSFKKLISYQSNLRQLIYHSPLNRVYILSDSFISLHEIRTGMQQICSNFSCTKDSPNRISISRCGKYIFIAFKMKIICWDIKLKIIIKDYSFNQEHVNYIEFNPNKNIFAISLLSNEYAGGGCMLYSTNDYLTVKNVIKYNLETAKTCNRFGMSINNHYSHILQRLDEIFNLDLVKDNEITAGIKMRRNSRVQNDIERKNVDQNHIKPQQQQQQQQQHNKDASINDGSIKSGNSSKSSRRAKKTTPRTNKNVEISEKKDIDDRTFSINDNSNKTFTLPKETNIFKLVTVKEMKAQIKKDETKSIEKTSDTDTTDATDISESLKSDKI